MHADSKRRQVSFDQLSGLLEFLKEHQELAKGLTRGRRGKLHTLKLWNLCAKNLNSSKDGAVKDGKGWSKYWCDWKYRVRRRALEIKAAKDCNRPPPDGITSLSQMEENILSIIGDNAVDGVVIKCDPLGEEDTFAEPDNESHCGDTDTAFHETSESRLTRSSKRRHHSGDAPDFVDVENTGPNSPREKKPKVNERNDQDSDNEEEAAQFLKLERQKLENSKSISDSLNRIANEITRLTDVMSNIRDAIINKVNNQM